MKVAYKPAVRTIQQARDVHLSDEDTDWVTFERDVALVLGLESEERHFGHAANCPLDGYPMGLNDYWNEVIMVDQSAEPMVTCMRCGGILS